MVLFYLIRPHSIATRESILVTGMYFNLIFRMNSNETGMLRDYRLKICAYEYTEPNIRVSKSMPNGWRFKIGIWSEPA